MKEVALLDIFSDGRVNGGAGRGFDATEFAAFDVEPEESSARFRENVEIVLAAWTNDGLTYDGEYYQFEDIEVLPKPKQQPHPLTWLAASSPDSIRQAAAAGHSIRMDPHATHPELPAALIECGDHVLVAVRVGPGRDARGRFCHGGHRHPFIGTHSYRWGGRTCRDGGQDRDEPRRQAPMRSRSPDRCVPVGARARSTDQNSGSRSAGQISSQAESAHLPRTLPARHQPADAAAGLSSLSESQTTVLCYRRADQRRGEDCP
jgi:hypothetical protein